MKFQHNAYENHIDNATSVLLCIHGIVGSPNHFTDFIDLLPQNIAVCNMLLAGHGGSTIDFAKSSMRAWKNCVEEKLAELSQRYQNIYIMAHSMGTLFAIDNSIKNPKIKGMFFLASPLYPKASLKSVVISLKAIFAKQNETDEVALTKLKMCSVSLTKKLWQYALWLPRFLELTKECKNTRKILLNTQAPAIFLQSAKDEVVKSKSTTLASKNENFKVITLQNSSHYLYSKEDYTKAKSTFLSWAENIPH